MFSASSISSSSSSLVVVVPERPVSLEITAAAASSTSPTFSSEGNFFVVVVFSRTAMNYFWRQSSANVRGRRVRTCLVHSSSKDRSPGMAEWSNASNKTTCGRKLVSHSVKLAVSRHGVAFVLGGGEPCSCCCRLRQLSKLFFSFLHCSFIRYTTTAPFSLFDSSDLKFRRAGNFV